MENLVMKVAGKTTGLLPMHKQHRFVENIFEELDAPGEWFYDTGTKTIYLYPLKGVSLQYCPV